MSKKEEMNKLNQNCYCKDILVDRPECRFCTYHDDPCGDCGEIMRENMKCGYCKKSDE